MLESKSRMGCADMEYEIIDPPFDLRFRELTKDQLARYYQWFIKQIPLRIDILMKAVRTTEGFERWDITFDPASLDPLGEWFASQVEYRARSEEEIAELEKYKGHLLPIPRPSKVLTGTTQSIAMDVGMYLGETLVRSTPSLSWQQYGGTKRDLFRGQPVISGFSNGVSLNPVHLITVFAHGIANNTVRPNRLREIFEIWIKQASHAPG